MFDSDNLADIKSSYENGITMFTITTPGFYYIATEQPIAIVS